MSLPCKESQDLPGAMPIHTRLSIMKNMEPSRLGKELKFDVKKSFYIVMQHVDLGDTVDSSDLNEHNGGTYIITVLSYG
jgi:hypothetical protein